MTMPYLLLFFGLLIPYSSWAYPQFIGYKYASCLTCHYNSQGNGAINDYGRALWATEIAGRAFAFGRTDEQLGEDSGFLGRKKLPYWIRPGLKARQVWVERNPGNNLSTRRDILMQADANLALFLGRDHKYGFVGSIGYVPVPQGKENQDIDTLISREHYLRVQATESLWLYLGMTDKVYGIRHANHTAYSRRATGLAQNDQAHGLIAHYIKPTWEFTVNLFAGNLNQEAAKRQVGVSSLFEYEIKESWRLGVSVLSSKNDFLSNLRLGFLSRVGYGKGSAVLFESGIIQDTPTGGDARSGYYIYSEAMQRIVRGYHIFVTGQAYKSDTVGEVSDNLKLGFGLLAFPMQRLEFRLEVENTQQITSSAEVPRYSWDVLGQIHISL